MLFRPLLDPTTGGVSYLLADDRTGVGVLIDPVLRHAQRDYALIERLGVNLAFTVETHVHREHITGATALRELTGCVRVASSKSSARADRSVHDGCRLEFGKRALTVRETPGHTSGSITLVSDNERRVFVGDLVGLDGRSSLEEGGDSDLWRASVQDVLFTLPKGARVYPAHHAGGLLESTVRELADHVLTDERTWTAAIAPSATRPEEQRRQRNLLLGAEASN